MYLEQDFCTKAEPQDLILVSGYVEDKMTPFPKLRSENCPKTADSDLYDKIIQE